MFVSTAYAQAGMEAAGPGLLQFLPIVLIFVVFYFLLIRPQQKRMKQHKDMLAAIRRGDRVVTGGGIIGTVTKVIDDNELQLEIAEGVRVRVQRPLVATVLAKTEPAGESRASGRSATTAAREETDDEDSAPPPSDSAPPAGPSDKGSRLRKILGGKNE